MKRTIRISSLALAAALVLGAGSAQALPVSLTLTLTSASTISLRVVALGAATGSVATSLTGTQDITLDDADPIATGISFDGGDIDIADASLSINLNAIVPIIGGAVLAELKSTHLTGLESTGMVPLNYTSGSWNYSLDPGEGGGTEAGIDAGLLTYRGTGVVGSLLGSGTLDFASSPVEFALPSLGQVASLTQTLLGSTGVTTTYSVVLSAPITFADTLLTDPVQVDATLNGNIVASGTYIVVPEPSTVVLVGVALLGLLPFYRRLRR